MNRTYIYSYNGTVVTDNTPDAHNRFMALVDAEEQAARKKARNIREYQRKLITQKQIGCALIFTGFTALALSAIIVECLACALPMIVLGVYAGTTNKVII